MLDNGRPHRVKCDWCGLKMACNCLLDNVAHHLELVSPRCQLTEVANEAFALGW
jgi:uncharacterized ferredoxin-like protein